MRPAQVRFPGTSGFGIKPVSKEGTERLVSSAVDFALEQGRKSVTIVHKGNIMKVRSPGIAHSAALSWGELPRSLVPRPAQAAAGSHSQLTPPPIACAPQSPRQFTEGAFKDWGYAVAKSGHRNRVVTERESWIIGNKDKDPNISDVDNAKSIEPGYDMMTPKQQEALVGEVKSTLAALYGTHGGGKWKKMLKIRDSIADITLQQVLTRPEDFDVIATLNLNGDYLSDALAAQVGGIGIAPGGNINYKTGHAIFEATHGTAPKYANLDKVNPGSMILSGEMMLRHMKWGEAADLIIKGVSGAIGAKTVTCASCRCGCSEERPGEGCRCVAFVDRGAA